MAGVGVRGVQFEDREGGRLSHIDAWASGRLPERRRHRGLPVRVQATYSAGRRRRLNVSGDLGAGGLFLHGLELLPPEPTVELDLRPGHDLASQNVSGTVTRRVDDADRSGMGVTLRFADGVRDQRHPQFVRVLEGMYVAGLLPEVEREQAPVLVPKQARKAVARGAEIEAEEGATTTATSCRTVRRSDTPQPTTSAPAGCRPRLFRD